MPKYTDADIAKQEHVISSLIDKISKAEMTLEDDTLRESTKAVTRAALERYEDDLITATNFYSEMVKK